MSASSPGRASRQAVRRPVGAVESLELLGDKPAAVFPRPQPGAADAAPAKTFALLDSRSQGWSAEELAHELYGNAGTPQAIRTEMFRVRSMLGAAVESNPYRFVAGVAGC